MPFESLPPRFLADDMLARLARWLRAGGIDVTCTGQAELDDVILRRSRREGRIVITRDLKFPGGKGERVILESRDLEEQMVELLRSWPQVDLLEAAFRRCMECNTLVEPEARPGALPAGIEGPFTRCPGCRRVYWEGSHV